MLTLSTTNVLTSLAELEQYFQEVALQAAREAQREFEVKLLDDLVVRGHTELAAKLGEIFNADA
jgi:hypothetical protein